MAATNLIENYLSTFFLVSRTEKVKPVEIIFHANGFQSTIFEANGIDPSENRTVVRKFQDETRWKLNRITSGVTTDTPNPGSGYYTTAQYKFIPTGSNEVFILKFNQDS